ncbi:S49 family peptidase [Xinfangfangia sp. CPCC 101601]|uniref:S49 family peptidase n=1 Tax=Pseudogemmobacter lacusdianii TaxID=3069608 RepID=A0ABU0VWR8_9RHOB|nr:S49 family peptidase [Xinfangfangia sp. CPCC 101601]MDQ2066216.1 S49 family peptidase [Xinfangfangia sp. CPCC 101601]
MKTLRRFLKRPPRIAVIRLSGTIGTSARSLNDAALAPQIEKAFRSKPVAVALAINSPGGSPVQSSLIASRIRRLADETKIPVHAFVEDIAASGGYWLATAADDIWSDRASILGSIGVIHAGFGFPDFLARHGIERRVETAGRSKSFADPFRPQTEEDRARIHALLTPMHQIFIDHVQSRRASKLAPGHDFYNADIWLGDEAAFLGVTDGIGHLKPKLTELYGAKIRLQTFGPKRGFLQRFGVSLMDSTLGAVEDRALWAQYGL